MREAFPGMDVWENPGIAPQGFVDFTKGQTVFAHFGEDGNLLNAYIVYLSYADKRFGVELTPEDIPAIELLLNQAAQQFAQVLTDMAQVN